MQGPADATPVFEAQKRAPAELKAVAEFLRGKNGPKVRRGILNGKRVEYFKGSTAIRTLTGPAYQKSKKVPEVKDEEAAKALLLKVLPHAFFLRVDRPTLDPPPPAGTPKTLALAPSQSVDEKGYYAWFYDGSPLYTILGGVAMVAVMLAGVMFPLWPIKLRIGAWYLSMGLFGLVGAFIVLAIVRLIFWCITVITMKRAIWIFPNLFEDVGFVDSFIPGWAYDEPKTKKRRLVKKSEKKGSKGSNQVKVSIANGVDAFSNGGANAQTASDATPAVPDAVSLPSAVETQSTGVSTPSSGLKHRQTTVEDAEED
ncbi:translocation protein Sec62-domain-containing protein [Kockovaella imperatae]|uniref:Translocation protein SEC62 n=1 Tax=Kockovaella imperatae TaxID=4999 RepID=A0A1Y1UNE5_9TREE|nr:translocation protein Sec62-domain-containing protein [Kockovaella imperatae]ORX39571.1 translocation protein Sec62-domain-containing protein [Kockovaella imperatae]